LVKNGDVTTSTAPSTTIATQNQRKMRRKRLLIRRLDFGLRVVNVERATRLLGTHLQRRKGEKEIRRSEATIPRLFSSAPLPLF
jgi:hypothetical protein